ncbi:MAG: tRNA 2-thiouridine(34) synthase MnmA [Patescibacteria group bacterium]
MLKNTRQRVALGMSGGVDSSLSAQLLVEAGYEVTGVYLECWRAPGCRTEEDRKDALKVALELGIKFEILDFKQEYKDRVVEYFFNEYEAGRTPNPDVMCNKEIKFGMFYDWAMEQGFDFVATGHYAGIFCKLPRQKISVRDDLASVVSQTETNNQNSFSLIIPADKHKDQTYFLYRLREEQLAHILFPIGDLTKDQVRVEAKKRGIAVADKPDSQGICFIGEINVHNFLKERLGENPGEVVNTAGEVIGRHTGLWFYTVGQRHGFEIDGTWKSKQGEIKHAMPPYYVIKKIPAKNQLVVGFGTETYRSEFGVEDVNWIDEKVLTSYSTFPLFVRIRHGGKLIFCKIEVQKNDVEKNESLKVTLKEPTQGIAEGQSAVFYLNVNEKYICLGGGVITE